MGREAKGGEGKLKGNLHSKAKEDGGDLDQTRYRAYTWTCYY
jgi:hypothetical protein